MPLILKRLTMLLLVVWMGLLISSCLSQESIKIGYAGELSGKRAEMGVDARNGAQLAIEIINANGGINGRPLELIVEDDRGEPEVAKEIDAKLAKAGVVAVIGHITSGQTAAVLDQINQDKVVLLSPTASSSQFSNQKDYFFRVQPSTDIQGASLARYAYHTMKLRQVSGIYDLGNEAFAGAMWQAFVAKFEELGGQIVQEFTFTSGQTDLNAFTQEVMDTAPSALVFVSSAVDTAFIIQQINLHEGEKPVFLSSTWAQTKELLAKGGRAIEGLPLTAMYNPANPNPAFQEFVQKFETRFNRKPDFAGANGYEAVQVLAEALKQTDGKAEGLPEALITIKNFPAIQGDLSLNEYGDVERDVYMMVVENGQFNLVETVSGD